jgi:hypothetical protein
LFPAYFLDAFANDTERYIANETSISLAEYVICQHGMALFISDDCELYREEWLRFIGVDREYADPYARILADSQYTLWQSGFLLLVTTDKGDKLYMSYMENDLDSPVQVRAFLYEANIGIKAILDGIAQDAPDYMQVVLYNYRNPIRVFFNSVFVDRVYLRDWKIELGLSHEYLHEMIHILIQVPTINNSTVNTEIWKYEAISQYLSVSFFQAPRLKKACYDTVQKALELYDKSDYIAEGMDGFFVRVARMYMFQNPCLLDSEICFDIPTYWKTIARVQTLDILANPDAEPVWARSIGSINYRRDTKTNGNEMTYTQAYAFADYLINKFGLSAYLMYCLEDVSFVEVYKLTYDTAKLIYNEEDSEL